MDANGVSFSSRKQYCRLGDVWGENSRNEPVQWDLTKTSLGMDLHTCFKRRYSLHRGRINHRVSSHLVVSFFFF